MVPKMSSVRILPSSLIEDINFAADFSRLPLSLDLYIPDPNAVYNLTQSTD
jgi:hypothetical protein